MKKNRVLVIGAHTDDIEMGCGGTISRLCERGDEVYYVTFSFSKKSLPEEFPKDTTEKESIEAAKTLRVDKDRIIQYSIPTRHFPEHRQEILENLIQLKNSINPEIVITHSVNDIHQDHNTIADESMRAFKYISIFCYLPSHNNVFGFHPQTFFVLNEIELTNKIEAVGKYKSQIDKTDIDYKEKIKSDAMYYGGMIKKKYAEVFESPRMIIE